MQKKLEELYKKSLLVQFLLLVPGKTLLLSSEYLIISRICGGWCSISCIYMKVKVKDTVIQQFLSTYVTITLPMMEDEVFGKILKADVEN